MSEREGIVVYRGRKRDKEQMREGTKKNKRQRH